MFGLITPRVRPFVILPKEGASTSNADIFSISGRQNHEAPHSESPAGRWIIALRVDSPQFFIRDMLQSSSR